MFGGKAAYPSYPLSGQYGKRNRTRYGSRWESLPRMVEAAGIEPASLVFKKPRRCATFVVNSMKGNELQPNSLSP